MNDNKPSLPGFPTWAAPAVGALLGAFFAYCTLLQNKPLSPLSPGQTLAIGIAIGTTAGVVVSLRERWRR